ncbi:uncharacterized protein LOC123871368 [Maniola jurtina]|uniref:uncharacterized protein LOC123871368 n=1 Tax=Maniola jurtina TaxID=191418 RepID=UPI001E688649|nr:uncharacterized protein LOC123871368 [Maniola jurtina]
MASLMAGDTLGQKHQNYNKLVNEAIKNNPIEHITAINYEESDLDNLYKIDIACNTRNVEYVLEVLKCEDMLYVSRVIKQSSWLITDPQYSSFINPEYLYNSLYPQMTSKAFNKLILHIRLNLKDEKRVEDFFNYYKEKDLQKAFKWLPGCSNPFIENIIQKHFEDIPNQIVKRLYKKSINFLKITIQTNKSYYKMDKVLLGMFHLKRYFEKFMDILDTADMDDIPQFGPKYTKIIMQKNPERIMKNLEKYVDNVDVVTFAKFLKKEEAKDFILTNIKNKKMRSWFNHKKIKYFLNRLPIEERFDFIKKYFIEKTIEDVNLEDETWDDILEYCSPPLKGNVSSSKNIYSWYVYAPFIKAFGDLKQLIRSESNPSDRIRILRVALTCAGKDRKNILALLKFYRENHINEPFKFKIQFVNHLLIKTDTHKYDKEAWGYLNDLFNSMEVYTKSDKNLQLCVRSIILRNLLNGENIPEIIEQKFEFENLDDKNKYNKEEREKIFCFLYNYLISKLKNDCNTEKEFDETVEIVMKVLNLLKDWNKDLKDYSLILQKIKDLVIVRKENGWNQCLSDIYNIKKSWRKLLLAESILLNPSEESCINALKYGPQLLEIYRKEINKLCISDNKFFEKFLKKIRIYCHQSLAKSFKKTFLENLNQTNGDVALIKGLCILLSRKEILDLIQKYVPTEAKIDWSQPEDLEFCLRKYIAKCMHLARPHPPLAVALEYAKGDFLQYVLPSLNAILYNIRSTYICEHIPELLNTPVSLQKHGIRVAFSKLKHDELKNIFSDIWKTSKNNTIRADIFCQTYKMLCKETDKAVILEIWQLLSICIDKLNFDENKKIYMTLSKADNVPLSVRAAFWMKSYEFLKKLPPQTNCNRFIDDLHRQIEDILEFLEIDFMAKIYFENFVKKFSTQQYDHSRQLSMYMLSAKTEKAQNERYEKILLPLLEKALSMWDKRHENVYYTRYNLRDIFAYMSREFEDIVLNKKVIFPIAMYTAALKKLENSLSVKENYILLTKVKLSLGYIQILHDLKINKDVGCSDSTENVGQDQEDKWKNVHTAAAPIFGRLCLNCLKEDVAKYFPSIYIIFADVLDAVLNWYVGSGSYQMNKLSLFKVFVESKDFIKGYLLVMKLMPSYYLYDDDERATSFGRSRDALLAFL